MCVFCRYGQPVSKYSLGALKINVSLWPNMCALHDQEVAARIIELEKATPEKYVLKTGEPKVFIPKAVEVKPNYQDREPNDGSLIE